MAEHFRQASSCPICFRYLEDPMRLTCGYTCCRQCTQSLQREPLGEGVLCPHCCVVSEQADIRPVPQLGTLVSQVKELEPKLRAVLQMSPRLKKFQVDVTLDVDTAHTHLVISEDLRSVHCGRGAQRGGVRKDSFSLCVLGTQRLASGRSYWEVDVGDSREWDVGACSEAAGRQGPVLLSTERGFWTVGLRPGPLFAACTVPPTELRLQPRLGRLGLLLDADLGLLTFCDVADGAHIFTFTGISARPLRPFFAPANALLEDSGVLRICPAGPGAGAPPGPPSRPPPGRPRRRPLRGPVRTAEPGAREPELELDSVAGSPRGQEPVPGPRTAEAQRRRPSKAAAQQGQATV